MRLVNIDVILLGVSPFADWRRLRASSSRAGFEAMYPCVFLVSAPQSSGKGLLEPARNIEFRTTTHKVDAASAKVSEDPLIMPLRKAESNPFPDRISIGRAPNCDVVVRDPSVSKLHGHFRHVTLESAWFTDAKSANGTRVDGSVLQPGLAVEIKQQSLIAFGRVRLMLVSPGHVYDML